MGLTPVVEPAQAAGSEPATKAATEPDLEQADVQPPPAAVVLGSRPGPILADDSYGQAGRKAMWPHVERLLKFERSLADASKTDDLKRYRVATRRLRAALRLFGPAYPDRQVRPLRDALGDLARAAGAVRDTDVRLADLAGWAEANPEAGAAVAPLRRAWLEERDRAAAGLLSRLETRRHQRLIRNLLLLVEGDGRLTPDGTRSVRDTVASRIWKAFEGLREAGTLVRSADLAAVHEVRIDAKRLRYSLEFLGDVLPESRKLLIARLVALQDHLGAINDAAVIGAAVRAVLVDRRVVMTAAERAAIGRYAADRDRDLARLGRDIGRPWRPIASPAFARRLGRTVVIV